MALPVINTPTYEFTVPSSKETVKFRPFLVKEEKALLLAQQSEDSSVMLNTLKSIIKSCTFDKLNVEKLALFDIEYIFTQLRAKSVGEISEIFFTCNECNDPKSKTKININLSELQVSFPSDHTNDITLFESVGIKMKYPSLNLINKIGAAAEDPNAIFGVIIECIDYIYDDNGVYPAAEQSKEELEQFINNLTQDQFQRIQQFFETMPRLEKKLEFNCPACGYHHEYTIQGIDGFFS